MVPWGEVNLFISEMDKVSKNLVALPTVPKLTRSVSYQSIEEN